MKSQTLRHLERTHPILAIPEVSPDPLTAAQLAALSTNRAIIAERHAEHLHERLAGDEQRLSNGLALCYGRDVFCSSGVPEGRWAEEQMDGQVMYRAGDPRQAYLRWAKWRRIKVAPDVAVRILRRDGGIDAT